MKKTIIALFTLGGVVMGDSVPVTVADASYSIYNATASTATLNFASDATAYTAMTLTFRLNADAFLPELYSCGQNHTNATLATVAGGGTNMGMAIRFNSSNNNKSSIYAVHNTTNNAANGVNGMSTGFGPTTWTTTLNGTPIADSSAFSDLLTTWGYNTTTGENNVKEMLCSLAYKAGNQGGQCYFTVVMDNGDRYEFSGATATNYKFSYADITNLSVNPNLVTDALMFDRVLSASDVISVHSGLMVPEPTTATLSLLALAGLAARRRRR